MPFAHNSEKKSSLTFDVACPDQKAFAGAKIKGGYGLHQEGKGKSGLQPMRRRQPSLFSLPVPGPQIFGAELEVWHKSPTPQPLFALWKDMRAGVCADVRGGMLAHMCAGMCTDMRERACGHVQT